MFSIDRKQLGFIVFGAGLNKRAWILEARAQGYLVVDCGEFATLHK